MGYWSAVQPESADVINYVTNPSGELATTGWAPNGGAAVSRVAGASRWGAYGLRLLAAAQDERVESANLYTTSGTESLHGSLWLKATSPLVVLELYNQTDGAVVASTAHSGGGTWERLAVTGSVVTGKAVRLRIRDGRAAAWANVDFDGAMLVRKAYQLTYFDGSIPGATWSGAEHASTSTASSQARNLGKIVALSDFQLSSPSHLGAGMPPLENTSTDFAVLDGAQFQAVRAKPRVLSLLFTAKGTSLATLHSVRQQLVDLVKPGRQRGQQPIILRYTGSGGTLQIAAYYDGGLDGGQPFGFNETLALRFIAYDPYFYSETEVSAALVSSATLTNTNEIAQRDANGQWGALGTGGAGGAVRAIVFDALGNMYAAGTFTSMGGVANTRGVAKWNGSAWEALGNGCKDGAGYALAMDSSGNLYLGGDFSAVKSAAAADVANTPGIAKYVPSTDTWSALGTGASGGGVFALAIANAISGVTNPAMSGRQLYAAGSFTLMGGVAATVRIARWNIDAVPAAAAWLPLGTGISTGQVNALALALDGSVYAGGTFTGAGGVTNTPRVARYGPASSGSKTAVWNAMSTGVTAGTVYALAVDSTGKLYVGGDGMTSSGVSSSSYFMAWSGSSWSQPPGGSFDAAVRALCVGQGSDLGAVYVGGSFTFAGTLTPPDAILKWVNGAYSAMNIDLPGTPVITAIAQGPLAQGQTVPTLTLGHDQTGSSDVATSNIAVSNSGSAAAYPRLELSGATAPTTLVALSNWTLSEKISFDRQLQPGERLVLDLSPGKKTLTVFSSQAPPPKGKNVAEALRAGSNVATWRLLPGTNSISAFAPAGAAVAANLVWRERYWSADGVPSVS